MPLIANSLKEKLARGETALSLIVRLVSSPEIAVLIRSAGYDSLYVDLEHNMFSIETTSRICSAALLAGIAPLVRVPGPAPEIISRVLDGGALGVIVPHVETAAQVREIVALTKFAPLGHRSIGGPLPHLNFLKVPLLEAQQAMNEATMVAAMLETRAALDNIEEIAAERGLDLLLVGANDLSAELGVTGQFDHPMIGEAFDKVIAACRRNGITAGIGGLAGRPDLIAEYVRRGARYVSAGSDFQLLQDAAIARVELLAGA